MQLTVSYWRQTNELLALEDLIGVQVYVFISIFIVCIYIHLYISI